MPRKKKSFINKKAAQVFTLEEVKRGQKDSLQAEKDARQRVLLPFDESSSKEVRKEEQRKYGIDYEDDYDYMQHLKDRKEFSEDIEVTFVVPATLPSQPKAVNRFQLRPEAFAPVQEVKVGMVEKAAPVELASEAPRYGPEVHETLYALDNDFDLENWDNELEDDFITQAGGEMAEGETNDDPHAGPSYAMEQLSEGRDYASIESGAGRMSCFAGASRITSATVRRNEGLQLLDEQLASICNIASV